MCCMHEWVPLMVSTGRYDPNDVILFDTPVFIDLTKWKPLISHLILSVCVARNAIVARAHRIGG